MKKMSLILLLAVVILFPTQLFSQTITGRILSARDSLPISGATVSIVGMDSVLINGGISNSDGIFDLKLTKKEQFEIIISCLGFSTEQISIKGISKIINIGDVFLEDETYMLDDVIISANNVVNNVDKSIIYPTSIQLNVSNSSLSLLQNLNLPGLSVDVLEQKININGSQPIYMINGIVKSKHEFLTINPKSISRIEYEDSPSIQNMDKNAGGVINVILKKKEKGGNFWGSMLGSPMTGFLNTDLYFAYNWTKSEFSINYFNNWRDYTHRRTDEYEKYITPDFEFERNFIGIDCPFGYFNQGLYLNYTYQYNAKTMFSATLRNDFGKQHTSVNGDISDSQKNMFYHRISESNFNSYIPALDLYFKRVFESKQSLEVNIVGTYLKSDYMRNLKDVSDMYEQKKSNNIDNSKKSIISEIVYKKGFQNTNLNLGFQNKISSSKNRYHGDTDEIEKLSENNNYLYGSLSGTYDKFSYRIGTGAKLFSVKDQFNSKVYLKNHSTLSLMYAPKDNFSVRLSAFYTPHLPELSQLSNVTQTYDEIMKIKGNPDLEAAYTIGSKLFASYKKGKFNNSLSLGFQRQVNTIYMDVKVLNDNIFMTEPRNAIGDDRLNIEYKCSFLGLLNHINLYSTIGFSSFKSESNDYNHRLNNFYWDVSAQIYWGKWTLSAYYVKPKKSLLAQTIDFGENNSQISLQFKHGNLDIMAAVKFPFEKKGWQWSEENLSNVNPSKTNVYIKDNSNMFVVGITYSFNFGKGLRKLSKNLSNSDATSILKVQE